MALEVVAELVPRVLQSDREELKLNKGEQAIAFDVRFNRTGRN